MCIFAKSRSKCGGRTAQIILQFLALKPSLEKGLSNKVFLVVRICLCSSANIKISKII